MQLGTNFLGVNSLQRDFTLDVVNAGGIFTVLDVNAAASNEITRIDYFACIIDDSASLFSTSSINNTNIKVRVGGATTNPNYWQKASGASSCGIIATVAPVVGEKLQLLAEISKGEFSYTKSFTITFDGGLIEKALSI